MTDEPTARPGGVNPSMELVAGLVDAARGEILRVSHDLHAEPELGFAEVHAHDVLCDALEGGGLQVERNAFGLPTAFRATAGEEGSNIGIVCEYDALPGLGHACGHNVIAAAGLGAGLALARLAQAEGGRVTVLGTPAEEGGGGKIVMLKAGAFEGLDAAMMIHPAAYDLTHMTSIAITQIQATYRGRAAHAAAAPHEGVNALDGAVLGYMNLAALRQHIRSDERVHGVFTHGGDKPNIVPDFAQALWYVRAGNLARLSELVARVEAALEAGAAAAGAGVELEVLGHPYAEVIDNSVLVERFAVHAAAVGRALRSPEGERLVMGSTDMGNVSYEVPSIHPMLSAAPDGTAIHTVEFEAAAVAASGDQAALDGAKCMAATAVDLWRSPDLVAAAAAELASARP